jgi:hypothetical protein
MAARTFEFVSKRLQKAVFAFLCLALAQLAMALASAPAPTQPSVRVHNAPP